MMMPDREKIIRGLERCLVCNTSAITSAEGEKAYRDCEYTVALYCRQDKLLRDVLTLLKEQEPVNPVLEQGSMVCGDCGHDVIIQRFIGGEVFDEKVSFCPACGRAVNWKIND
jgi:hypothetical protein